MNRRSAPGVSWLLGVMIAALLVGGVTTIMTSDQSPVRTFGSPVETVTSIHTEVVPPEGQSEVQGTVASLSADEANGPPLAMPIDASTGGATIESAVVDGRPSTIVWDGGRPLHMSGTGSIDLGPTHVELDARGLRWAIDGVRVLTPGTYRIDTPVAVGSGGLAHPADSVTFTATGDTTITTHGIPPIARGIGPVHLSGPGTLHATGQLTIRTRKGTTAARQLTFGPGPFLVDLGAGGSITATFNGPLTSQ